mgnify:CR=1 FL=1
MESFFGWSKSKCIKFLTNPDARLSNLFNKNTKGLYELGSLFKTFVIANELEKKRIKKTFKSIKNYSNAVSYTHLTLPTKRIV